MTAEEIKALRLRTGLSQAKFARLLGVGAVTIHKWEHGVQPYKYGREALAQVAAALEKAGK